MPEERSVTGAMVGLVTSEGDGPDAPVHVRMWLVPPEVAAFFAEEMTKRFGEPSSEGLSTMGASRTLADDGTALFLARSKNAGSEDEGHGH